MRLARGSARYLVLAFATLAVALAVARLEPLAWPIAALTGVLCLFFLWFFRDPERSLGAGVVSPADGRVLNATDDAQATRLAIFMSPVDVHVNRAPLDGRVDALEYHRGGHLPAFKKESERNERLELDLSTSRGPVRVRLIAGTVARRIHPYLSPGAVVKKGDRIGLIAFGSRCELVLPPGRYRLLVGPGASVKAGHTTVAEEVG
jgi:phosphatidylserine decarboxylase